MTEEPGSLDSLLVDLAINSVHIIFQITAATIIPLEQALKVRMDPSISGSRCELKHVPSHSTELSYAVLQSPCWRTRNARPADSTTNICQPRQQYYSMTITAPESLHWFKLAKTVGVVVIEAARRIWRGHWLVRPPQSVLRCLAASAALNFECKDSSTEHTNSDQR